MKTIKDRIQAIVYDKTENNYSEFCRKTGLSNGFIHSISDQVQEKTIRKIMRAFPDINEGWLKFGKGDMYKEVKRVASDEFYQETIHDLLTQLEKKDRLIEEKDRIIEEKNRIILNFISQSSYKKERVG